ncbi:hypothetical protein [Solimonas aquatica]|nr:hypothetical protein [Solimonas aquatica]
MTAVTATIALLISLASFAFSVYQYRILQKVRVGEKASVMLRLAYDLRRKSEDLKHKVDSTDNVPDYPELFAKVDTFVGEGIKGLMLSQKLSWDELLKIEQRLLPLELELDLFYKQVVEAGRFNDEVRAYEKAKAQKHEL